MSISLPSQEAYVIDAPEIRDLKATFQYNFFSRDEGTIDDGGIDVKFLEVQSEDLNAGFVRYATTRAPRFVILRWTPSGNSKATNVVRGTIRNNLSKILNESDASTFSYFSTTFDDVDHSSKFVGIVSGTLLQGSSQAKGGNYVSANLLVAKLPNYVDGESIVDALTQPVDAFGGRFFTKDGLQTTSNIPVPVPMTITLNAKFAGEILKRSQFDPVSQHGDELKPMIDGALKLSEIAKKRANAGIDDKDSQLVVSPIAIDANGASILGSTAQVVGYVIDKYEHHASGAVELCDQIIIENPQIGETVDLKVRYGATYSYSIKTIVLLKNPGIDTKSGIVATISFLASSKSSNRQIVSCVEMLAPPPPGDIQGVWDYENDRMWLQWVHPVNPQRDIKGFQIFRREKIEHPFELIKYYKFNDATTQDARTIHVVEANIEPSLIEDRRTAVGSFIDVEFNRRSKYIYTICSIDAHGLTSNYGVQLELSFDEFKNALVTKHVSHSGAPKSYPNMYLKADLFVDTMRTTGGPNRVLKVYLTPEAYETTYSDGRKTDTLAVKQDGSKYVMQIINLDRQVMKNIDITVDDRTQRKTQEDPRKTDRRRSLWK